MKSQGLAEVHASVTCLFSHWGGERGGGGGASEGASGLPIRGCGGVNSHGVHFDISDGVVKKKKVRNCLP